nr:unnamed protein product [Digitaria exilis]
MIRLLSPPLRAAAPSVPASRPALAVAAVANRLETDPQRAGGGRLAARPTQGGDRLGQTDSIIPIHPARIAITLRVTSGDPFVSVGARFALFLLLF